MVGRKYELDRLHASLKSENSALIAVYGRRRVGKTYLIRNVCLEYSAMIDAGNDLHNYSNEEFGTMFFQYMDSTQESQVNSFVALASDSVYIYSLERVERGFQSNSFSEEQHSELLLYPNPVSQILNIEFADVKGALFVTDLLGQVKYAKNDFAYFETINTAHYSNGVYIVVVIDETGNRVSSRFIVLK